jgi:hypothetical protein
MITKGRVLPVALALLLASCAPAGFQQGVERVHETWLTDNSRIYSAEGSRSVTLDPTQARQAARFALERIGLTVTRDDPSTGVVEADRALTSADISGAVRDAELPRVQQIMSEEMGAAGASIPMGLGEGSLLVATATVAGAGDRSTVEVRMCNGARSQTGGYIVGRCVIPTAQLRAGLNEFWRAFDQEAAALEAQRPRVAGKAQSAPASAPSGPLRPPSQWVLPD